MKEDELFDILLVEDSSEDLELTIHALSHTCGLKFLHLRDGVEALRFFFSKGSSRVKRAHQSLKLIMLDLKLPKVDGLELLRKLRADESTRMIPVVMFSSSKQVMDVAEAYNLGVNSYVVKPLDFDKYVKAVGAISSYWSNVNQNCEA
jgi:two-component system response regulator